MITRPNRGGSRTAQQVLVAAAILAVLTLGVPAVASRATATPAATPAGQPASAITDIVKNAMATEHLRSVIIKVTKGDQVVTRQAFGESMEGVPATTDMHVPNGNVAFAYLGTLLLEFVDEHKVGLDDTIDRWMPDLPEGGKVTLKMLANHTSGYPDYETDPAWLAAWSADPFHIWTFQERLTYAFSRPVLFAPGTNWAYAHTNFMILGEILARIGGKPLATLLSEKVLGPMGLTGTAESQTSAVPSPVLHSYTSERREALGIPAGTAFYEVLEQAVGHPDRSEPDDDHRRHGRLRRAGRHRRAAVGVQLPRHDRPEPGGLRQRRPQLCARLPPDDRRTQFRSRHRAQRFLAPPDSQPGRLQRGDGVPAFPKDRHRGGHHLPARRVRRAGEQPEFRHPHLPVDRSTDGTERLAPDAE
jgi:CubicO group peptidase (beta-lactamase class C family)